ncbi:MAG: flagellar biosynthesis protein FlhA [Holosporales bacterium]|jgi:flagellar biosynthesis protein FlhA|nr:flagellar biosynthesis protein FlhA [Holosporales bacterium]
MELNFPKQFFSLYTHSMERLRDVGFAIGLALVLVILIMPMPRWMMDFALAASMLFSIMVLMTVLFVEKSVDFNVFPTVLLVSTILRLALNLASTRLILSHGHEGVHAAGEVIYAFGSFIVGGNFFIGVIVFTILIIVNFVVITKGSGRIAEVFARFTLDALPGKQMAIDADLSSGTIDEKTAKQRRKELESETNFYGAMDGAAKFVRGDAIAGVIITLINIIAGIIIGVMQKGISLQQASASYTLLTVGDGLVSQMPALIVSTAAGMLVSKSGTEGTTDKAFFEQLSNYPNALWMSAVSMACLAMLPGIPKAPFILCSVAVGYLAYKGSSATSQAGDVDTLQTEPEEESLSKVLHVEILRLELGSNLSPLADSEKEGTLGEKIKVLRRSFAADMGLLLPSVCIQENKSLEANNYIVKIKEIECGRGSLRPDKLMTVNPTGTMPDMEGEKTIEPIFGLPALWIDPVLATEAEAKGYSIIDPTAVLLTHMESIFKRNIADLFSSADMQRVLSELPEAVRKLVSDIVPSQISLSVVLRVFQNLLEEDVSIRDTVTIIESIAEVCSSTRSVSGLVEQVRMRLSRQICSANVGENGVLSIITLLPETETMLSKVLTGDGDNKRLALAPSNLQQFAADLRQAFDKASSSYPSVVFVVPATMRRAVRAVIERLKPDITVMSQNEIHPKVKIKMVGHV